MSGSVLTVGVIAATAAVAVAFGGVGAAAVCARTAAGAADAAALAAADAASGAVSGIPCERADEVARADGGVVLSCVLVGLVATVSVQVRTGILTAQATARAGPPP